MLIELSEIFTVEATQIKSIIKNYNMRAFGYDEKYCEARITMQDDKVYTVHFQNAELLATWYSCLIKAANCGKMDKGQITKKRNLEAYVKQLKEEEKQAKLAIKGFENSIKNLIDKERMLRREIERLQELAIVGKTATRKEVK